MNFDPWVFYGPFYFNCCEFYKREVVVVLFCKAVDWQFFFFFFKIYYVPLLLLVPLL